MPYLPTSQTYLEQSSLLLQAYPDTRITTKYTFPPSRRSNNNQNRISKPDTSTTTQPVATLTLKTFNPTAGICLKYRTNKAAEVGRLILSLGKLAGGADVEGLGLTVVMGTGAAPAATGGDIEMADLSRGQEDVSVPGGKGDGGATAKGGKSKKKGGKGKR